MMFRLFNESATNFYYFSTFFLLVLSCSISYCMPMNCLKTKSRYGNRLKILLSSKSKTFLKLCSQKCCSQKIQILCMYTHASYNWLISLDPEILEAWLGWIKLFMGLSMSVIAWTSCLSYNHFFNFSHNRIFLEIISRLRKQN